MGAPPPGPVARLADGARHRSRSMVLHDLRRARGAAHLRRSDANLASVRRLDGDRRREQFEHLCLEALRTMVLVGDRRAARARLDADRVSLEPHARHRGLPHQLRAGVFPCLAVASESGDRDSDGVARAPRESVGTSSAAPVGGSASAHRSVRISRAGRIDVSGRFRRGLRALAERAPGMALTR